MFSITGMVPILTDGSQEPADAGGVPVALPMLRSLAPATVALALLAPAAGWAAPFKFTPADFQQWLNANPGRWQEGRRVIFSNLSGCAAGQMYPNTFTCYRGFARITDPMGSRVCRLREVSWRGVDQAKSYCPSLDTKFDRGTGVPIQPTRESIALCEWSRDFLRRPLGASYREGECLWQ